MEDTTSYGITTFFWRTGDTMGILCQTDKYTVVQLNKVFIGSKANGVCYIDSILNPVEEETLLFRPFFDTSLYQLVSDSANNISERYLPNSIVEYSIDMPGEDDVSDIIFKIRADTISKMITFFSISLNLYGGSQYKSWEISELFRSGDEIDHILYVRDSILNNCKSVQTRFPMEEDTDNAIFHEGDNFEKMRVENDLFQSYLKELHIKNVLLDFWYSGCYPCLKSIPYVSKLQKEVAKDKLIVIGINSIDSQERINTFMKKHKVENEVYRGLYQGDSNLCEGIKGYPLFILLNSKRTVTWLSEGFDETKFIDSVLVHLE